MLHVVVNLDRLGAAVREVRVARGLTLAALATRSGVSSRFLSDLERGVGNISVGRLVEVARALDVRPSALVAALDEGPRRRSVALVGLRGAGKTTVGERLAGALDCAFVELDREIELEAGLPLAQIFELHGEAYYRRLERAVLAKVLDGPRAVIAVGGGVVTDASSWALLRREALTLWLEARPEQHYQRVMSQGDLRPMKNRPAAMAELRSLLAARAPFYAESEHRLDTSRLDVDRVVEAARALVESEG